MNNTYIVIAVIAVILMMLYINDINNKLKALDDREHLSKTPKNNKLFSGAQIAIIVVILVVIMAIIGGVFIFANKSSAVSTEY